MNRERIIAEARAWIGTPYRHRATVKGAGCDCLGLVMGVYAAVVGPVPEAPPAYSRDWAETGGAESLLAAARRHLREKPLAEAEPGDVLVFRMEPRSPAKHCGILVAERRMVHAMEHHGVTEIALSPWWARKAVAVFAWPEARDPSKRAHSDPPGHLPRQRGRKEGAPTSFSSPARGGGPAEGRGGGSSLASDSDTDPRNPGS